MSAEGALDLAPNESSDILNCFPVPGRLQYRGGWYIYSTVPAPADYVYAFKDSADTLHYVVWANGQLYEVTGGIARLIIPSTQNQYTPKQRVGAVSIDGILYWSTQTVPLQYWNPQTDEYGAVVQTGVSPPPASPYLFLYTNAIVALSPDFGTGPQYNVFSWSEINLPANWDAANSQAVGPNNGGALEFGVVFGIAEIGVSPFRNFVIGRNDEGIYGYQGALGSLSEFLVNAPVGCLDGSTAQYIPGMNQFGNVIFLGTDNQFWTTNGVTATVISLNILPLLQQQIENTLYTSSTFFTLDQSFLDGPDILAGANSLASGISQLGVAPAGLRFWAGYNDKRQYYFCNIGDTQFVFKWDLSAWSLFKGWPVGPILAAPNSSEVPTLYVAGTAPLPGVGNTLFVLDSSLLNGPDVLSGSPPPVGPVQPAEYPFAVVAVDQASDNGVVPDIHYTTSYQNFGNPEKLKEFHWIAPFVYSTGTTYNVSGVSLPRPDGSYLTSNTLIFPTPAQTNTNGLFRLDSSLLDGPDVLADNLVYVPGLGIPIINHGRFSVPITLTSGALAGLPGLRENLRGGAAQFTLAYGGGTVDFELDALEVRYIERGFRRDGGSKFNVEGGVPAGPNSYVPPG